MNNIKINLELVSSEEYTYKTITLDNLGLSLDEWTKLSKDEKQDRISEYVNENLPKPTWVVFDFNADNEEVDVDYYKLKKYDDFKLDKSSEYLTKDEISNVSWTKYKIIVPTHQDKKELEEAFRHIHYSDIDTDYVTVNQLAHEYLNQSEGDAYFNNIIVDEELYKKIGNRKG